ncbi:MULTISPECIES: hypothetical protein [Microbacterium]|uniref:Integral membrane protein n=1 Tax=Microbacterium marmarense TaxID=3122051 RepID=A0ABU8LYL6_9MICO
MTARHYRALRGATAAWVATIIAATSHTLSGGGAPHPLLVVALAILLSPVAVAIAGRRLALWRMTATVLASQMVFHLAFAMTSGASASSGTVEAATSTHAHHVLGSFSSAGVAGIFPDAAMLAGHLTAAIVTVAGLYFGGRMLRTLGRGVRSIFARAHALIPLDSLPCAHPAARVLPTLRAITLLSDVSRRGPPAFVSAAL